MVRKSTGKQAPASPAPTMEIGSGKFLTIKEVAELLQMTEDGVRKQVYKKMIPAKKHGKKWRIPRWKFYELMLCEEEDTRECTDTGATRGQADAEESAA